ncbi:sensor histidine kinase [Nocardioides campestrisoli]|uniref:sensor histidine kinase n=1 Tax=Nocardioides campestrisoli TaxID=2736757 RepID=UPI0015E76165|nr:GAF domain-containing sensor histidine kinase [Nocardioides campestrisoli]
MGETRAEDVFVDALQNIARGVTELVGYEVAAISVARDDRALEMVAVAGSVEAREQLLGHRTPIDEIELEIATAEHWGDLRFVPHERMNLDIETLGWVPDLEVSNDPDMWHPLDLLLAPIYDDEGTLRGMLSVDLPLDRRRPGPQKRQELQRYAEQTRRAVLTAVERAELAEQVRLADAARMIVREVSSELSLDRIIEVAQPALTSAFNSFGMWIETFDEDGEGSGAVYASNGAEIHLAEELKQIARLSAQMLWKIQDVVVLNDVIPAFGVMTPEQEEEITSFMQAIDVTSMLFVPLGAGPECLGNLVLTRRGGKLDWSPIEKQAALDIGHDLGRALLNARTFERERRLIDELRELNGYKSRLIATIAHELKNPLTSILGHVEMLESVPELTGTVRSSISSMERGAVRMQRLIDDLLVLARVGDPHVEFRPTAVNMTDVVHDVLDLVRVTLERKQLKVVVDAPEHPVLALAEESGLDRICANLLSNAAKYTPEGGTITITLESKRRVAELRVSDTGLGISEADQGRLFQEFFRSTNPAAVAQPGTGLGLTIVQRIVERHRGRITFESTLGEGTTFAVTLPLAREGAAEDQPVEPPSLPEPA